MSGKICSIFSLFVLVIAGSNAEGKLRQITDPDGLDTTYTDDERNRLLTANQGGEVASYDYTPSGSLKRLTLPDGSYLEYGYDDYDRLVSIEGNLGHRIVYTLDGIGNRLSEATYDPDGDLVERIRQTFDALSCIETVIGAEGQLTSYGHDANGNETSAVDPNSNATTSTYDKLNRLETTMDPDTNVIEYAYDDQDNLTSVTDPRDLTTSYAYNGFDELTTLDSPDTGVTSHQYDFAGNLTV